MIVMIFFGFVLVGLGRFFVVELKSFVWFGVFSNIVFNVVFYDMGKVEEVGYVLFFWFRLCLFLIVD